MSLDDFMTRATLAGLGMALAGAPLGCFVVLRRMAYFGDATAHAAILGVALSLAFSVPVFAGVLVVSLAMAFGVATLSNRGHAMDTLLGVMADSALAAALGAVSVLGGLRLSERFDTPTGPTVVCVTATLFCLASHVSGLRRRA